MSTIIEMSASLMKSKKNRKQLVGFIGKHETLIKLYIGAAKIVSTIIQKPMYVHINMDYKNHHLRKFEITDCVQDLVFPKFLSNEIKWIGVSTEKKSIKSILDTLKTL